jgi:3-oxoacyl-[acyl-carrier protein] reductase
VRTEPGTSRHKENGVASVQEMFDLSGKVAVLTGVGSGIGKASASTLAGAGATIVGGDIDEAAAKATADEIADAGGAAVVQRTDVTQRADVDGLLDRAASEYGRIDIVGNIAGIPHNKLVAECSDEEFERLLAINLKSVFYGCQAAIRHMIPQGSGCIVNISSGAIDTPAPTLACYGMTKAAVAMLTKTLATEVGRHGIRVNAIAPGMILTNFSRHNFVDENGDVIPEKLEQYHKRAGAMAPLGRAGEAQDVANTFLYLVSDAAAFVTGQIERPNGGVAMPW